MNKHILAMTSLMMSVLCGVWIASAQPAATPPQTAASSPFVLGPPQEGGPVVVRASFEILEISAINDDKETFEFTGIMTLKWSDRRQAFDPAAAGVKEKIYQGDYQFNELSPAWFPQVVLVNSAGSYDSQGVVLRAEPDGTQTLIEKISAVAKTDLNLRRFPFHSQTLNADFQVLGFDRSEVALLVDPAGSSAISGKLSIPQWFIRGVSISSQDRPTFIAGKPSVTSGFVTSVDARRASFYISRLVVLPLVVIVLLSFSVFWIEPSSTSDRMNISFIGILTAVAYQLVMNDTLPRIAYVTWMNACLSLSFLMMVGTVVVHLTVGNLDRKGNAALALRIDRYCRWVFPLAYVGLLVGAFLVTFFIL